ncbi:PAS domain S-box protein [Neobacillus thermocopriae]|uniref:PAS domain S-box protein n=1 Tax=Neobacillus thermocopriae TaxID=1215031 RepID=UPI0037705730
MSSSISNIKRKKKILLEKHLSKGLSSYESLFACDSDAIYAMDLDGYFIPLNPACEQIFGYEASELSKMSYVKVVKLEHLDRAISFFYKSLEGKLQNFDCQIIHKSGKLVDINITIYPIVISEEIVGVYAIAKDITEIKERRRKQNEELRQREEVYMAIVEHSPDAVVIAKKEEILYVNDTAVALIGAKDKSELIGKSVYDYLDDAYCDIVRKRVEEVESGKTVEIMEEKLIRKDGEFVYTEIKSIPAIYQNQPVRHIMIRDITEKKKRQEMLLQSEKLSAARQLADGIVHEMNHPLSSIKEILMQMEAEQKMNSTYIERIQTEVNRMEWILNELLQMSKPEERDE